VLDLTNQLPSREICQPFFENFLFSIHPIIPICHIPTLRRGYNELWANLSPQYSTESLALILAVLYTGAANLTVVDVESCSALLQFWEMIFNTIDFAGYHARNIDASLQILQSYIIMNTFKASHLAPYSAFGFLPQTIRFAQSLRLHVGKETGDPIHNEIRRRIWWHLLFLDVESTIATGLPPIIHRSGFTAQLPSLRGDNAIYAPLVSSKEPVPYSPLTIAIQGHFQWANGMQIWFEALPSQDEVSKFKSQINSLLDLIPDNKRAENEWARIYLKMQIDRAYCMLGLRFWQLDQYKGTRCHSEVVQCVSIRYLAEVTTNYG
jgi:Fungal specific transcription factor domain